MSGGARLRATAGGSVTMVADDTLTTDETFNVSEGGIESGSNVNGWYTKFPDGTLICTTTKSPNTASSTVWFATAFSSAPIVTATSSSTTPRTITVSAITTTNVTVYRWKSDGTGDSATWGIHIQAIGRWK